MSYRLHYKNVRCKRRIFSVNQYTQSTLQAKPMCIVCVVLICDTWEICLVFCKQIPDQKVFQKRYKKIEVSLCLQNTKQIFHVSKIKTTETIRMGFACSADCTCSSRCHSPQRQQCLNSMCERQGKQASKSLTDEG